VGPVAPRGGGHVLAASIQSTSLVRTKKLRPSSSTSSRSLTGRAGEPPFQPGQCDATLLQVAVVVARVHDGQDRPVDEDVQWLEQREVVHQLLREHERLAAAAWSRSWTPTQPRAEQGESRLAAQVDEEWRPSWRGPHGKRRPSPARRSRAAPQVARG